MLRAVTLTGSNAAGSHIAQLAGKYIKKTVLELGGSDPFIIFGDADLDKAVEYAIIARFQNTGQSCIAAKRFFVHENIYHTFLGKFAEAVSKLNVGDPMISENYIGPMARPDLVDEIERQVNESVACGAKILYGGQRLNLGSNYFSPTILIDAPKNSPVWNEEIFGPVAPVFTFKTDQEAIQLANDTNFGLGATLWTNDIEKAKELSREIMTGVVAINGMVKSEPALPFGGVKDSGYGRELSEFGLKEFLNIKTLNVY